MTSNKVTTKPPSHAIPPIKREYYRYMMRKEKDPEKKAQYLREFRKQRNIWKEFCDEQHEKCRH